MIIIQVMYVDDNGMKHLSMVRSFRDLKFLQERYNVIDYEVM